MSGKPKLWREMTNDELIARAEAALVGVTNGPWEVKYMRGVTHLIMDGDSQMGDETYYPWVPDNLKDWEFFAAARDLVPDLIAALKASEARVTTAAMLEAYDDFLGGGANSELARTVANAAIFAAAAYENGGRGNAGTHAMARAFLLAAMDHTDNELDYLRADPVSGEVARNAAKKLRAITETPSDRT